MTAWLAPTARATSWWPLAAVTGYLVASVAVTAVVGTWPTDLMAAAAAALAAATVAGLRDPAAALLSAVPVSATTRRAHRLALLLPAQAAIWFAWVGAGHQWSPGLGWPVSGLAALTVGALAMVVWAPPDLAVPLGAGLPLAVVLTSRFADVAWEKHTDLLLVAATAALLTGPRR